MGSVYVGQPVLVAVPPDSNDGYDYAPGFVTAVAGDATVSLFVASGRPAHTTGVVVHDTREAMDAELAPHLQAIDEANPRNKDANGNPIMAKPSDVYRWVTAAWVPPTPAAVTPQQLHDALAAQHTQLTAEVDAKLAAATPASAATQG